MRNRLDAHLVAVGAFPSRARARAAIDAGCVRIDGAVALKASQAVSESSRVTVTGDAHDYVSRGGVKLEAALVAFEIDPAGKICLDLGASTGGFSDALLRRRAAKIFAVDVGAGQMHEKIAADARVVRLEKTNARDLSRATIADPLDLIVCDVSFISLKLALPSALSLTGPDARLVALVKPQFEVGPARIGKGGIVKPDDARGAAADLAAWMAAQPGWRLLGVIESPISGGDGNRGFLIGAARDS